MVAARDILIRNWVVWDSFKSKILVLGVIMVLIIMDNSVLIILGMGYPKCGRRVCKRF